MLKIQFEIEYGAPKLLFYVRMRSSSTCEDGLERISGQPIQSSPNGVVVEATAQQTAMQCRYSARRSDLRYGNFPGRN